MVKQTTCLRNGKIDLYAFIKSVMGKFSRNRLSLSFPSLYKCVSYVLEKQNIVVYLVTLRQGQSNYFNFSKLNRSFNALGIFRLSLF